MTIAEMHVWFRQYAQQMGMQNVRAILPEQIDLLINTSINDIINQLFRENIGITNDRIITDNSKIGQINAFRTLYNVVEIEMNPATPTASYYETRVFSFDPVDRLTGKMSTRFVSPFNTPSINRIPEYLYLVDFSLNYKKVQQGYPNNYKSATKLDGWNFIFDNTTVIKSFTEDFADVKDDIMNNRRQVTHKVYITTYTVGSLTTTINKEVEVTVMWDRVSNHFYGYVLNTNPDLVASGYSGSSDFYLMKNSVGEYILVDDPTGYTTATMDLYTKEDIYNTYAVYDDIIYPTDAIETNYFPVRLIDDMYLADTLNDFVLRNRVRSPIIVTYNNGTFDLYIDEFKEQIISGVKYYVLPYDLVPYKLRMSYIAKPAVVKYAADMGGVDVDCNLPESMHVDILKHAVDLYNTSLQGNLYSQQQQQQAQQREQARNQVRPENEGYKN